MAGWDAGGGTSTAPLRLQEVLTEEEEAAIDIQRITRGKSTRRHIMDTMSSSLGTVSSGLEKATTGLSNLLADLAD